MTLYMKNHLQKCSITLVIESYKHIQLNCIINFDISLSSVDDSALSSMIYMDISTAKILKAQVIVFIYKLGTNIPKYLNLAYSLQRNLKSSV